jgi:hypothetical protein
LVTVGRVEETVSTEDVGGLIEEWIYMVFTKGIWSSLCPNGRLDRNSDTLFRFRIAEMVTAPGVGVTIFVTDERGSAGTTGLNTPASPIDRIERSRDDEVAEGVAIPLSAHVRKVYVSRGGRWFLWTRGIPSNEGSNRLPKRMVGTEAKRSVDVMRGGAANAGIMIKAVLVSPILEPFHFIIRI